MENLWLNFIKTDTKNLMIASQQNKKENQTQHVNPNDTHGRHQQRWDTNSDGTECSVGERARAKDRASE